MRLERHRRRLRSTLTDLQPPWQRILKRAGIEDIRIHDLRHTFASAAVAAGQRLPMIGKLLGHTQVQTTARYAHLAADPVRAAENDKSKIIAKSMRYSFAGKFAGEYVLSD
jgi:integrase